VSDKQYQRQQKELIETIAAIATPLGQGGVGIVRLSGPQSVNIIMKLFRSAKVRFQGLKPYTLHHGWIHDPQDGAFLDEVLVSYMPEPGSYTGEDVVEINCHGGPAIVQKVLELVLNTGARMAQPGEFTSRAFWNGRLDLSQAESIAEMIAAQNQFSMQMAGAKLQGGLSQVVASCRERLKGLRAYFCLLSDFPEEEEDKAMSQEIENEIQHVKESIKTLLTNFSRYNCWRDGSLVVFAGRVNVGKSSLFNAVLGRKRAIVNPTPGTTRDYLEEMINLNGLPVRLVDIAGLRQTVDSVEQEGLEQGQELMNQADLICLLFDMSCGPDEETLQLASHIARDKLLVVANKVDLSESSPNSRQWFLQRDIQCLSVSAKTGIGIEELLQVIRSRLVGHRQEPREEMVIPNMRQSACLKSVDNELTAIEQDLSQGVPVDLIDLRLESCCNNLSEVTGEITSEDVLDQIFSNFCIGK
jgi:tRNA modification GTPase